MDPAREFQLRRVLDREAASYLGRFDELKYLLAPYLATSAAEQARFYELWDDFVAECEREAQPETINTVAALATEPVPWYVRHRNWILTTVVLALLMGLLYVYFIEPSPTATARVTILPSTDRHTVEGEPLILFNGTPISKKPEDSLQFRWEIKDALLDSVLFTTADFEPDWRVPLGSGRQLLVTLSAPKLTSIEEELRTATFSTIVYCNNPPKLDSVNIPPGPFTVGEQATFEVFEPEDDIIYRWTFGSGNEERIGAKVSYTFPEDGPLLISLNAITPGDSLFCVSSRIENRVVGNNLPFLANLPLHLDPGTQQLNVIGWLWGLLLLPLLLSLPLWLAWWRKRNPSIQAGKSTEELQADYPIHDSGPYDIPYRAQDGQITAPTDFFRIADQLRVREAGMRRTFDARGTVNATIKSGGFPKWKDVPIKRPAAYLMLVRHTDDRNQQDRLMKRLASFLVDREAAITVYYHGGHFDHFWNKDYPDGWPLAQLFSRYPEHRLIIAGSAHGLVDPFESQQPRLKPALQQTLLRWDRRLVLSTEPVVDWSFQEVLLHQNFILYPATAKGIKDGVFMLNETEEYEASNYPNREVTLAKKHPEPSYRYRRWDSVEVHRKYLANDPVLFRWLCGLAVCSQPNWDLTIAIGRSFGIEVTHDRLLQLSRIPWLAENRPEHGLRFQLLKLLSPADDQLARQCVLDELEAVSLGVKNSFAETEWTTHRALQKFAIAPENPEHKQAIRDLRELGYFSKDQLDELDFEVSDKVTKNLPPAEHDETPNLEEWLNRPEKKPWLTLELVAALFLCLLSLVASLWANDYNKADHPYDNQTLAFWQQPVMTLDSAREKNNDAVNIWQVATSFDSPSQYRLTFGSAERQLNEAIALRQPATYPIADSNLIAIQYNTVRKEFNSFLLDSISFAEWATTQPDSTMQSLVNDQFTQDNPLDEYQLYLRHALGLVELRMFEGLRILYNRDSTEAIARINFSRSRIEEIPSAYRYFFQDGQLLDLSTFEPGAYLMTAVEHFRFLDSINGHSFFDSIAAVMPYNLKTEIQPYLAALSAVNPQIAQQQQQSAEQSRAVEQKGEKVPVSQPNASNVIFGIVRDPSGRAVANARVSIIGSSGGKERVEFATTNNNGRFVVSDFYSSDQIYVAITAPGGSGLVDQPRKAVQQLPGGSVGEFELALAPTDDPMAQLVNDWKEKEFLLGLAFENTTAENLVAFPSYFTSRLVNDQRTTVTEFDVYAQLLSRDLNASLMSDPTTGQFLFFGPQGTPEALFDQISTSGSYLHITPSPASIDYALRQERRQVEEELRQNIEASGFSYSAVPISQDRDGIIKAFNGFANSPQVDKNQQIIVYISGYLDEKKRYIYLANSTPENIDVTGFDVEQDLDILLQQLNPTKGPRHLLVFLNTAPYPAALPSVPAILPEMVEVPSGVFSLGSIAGDEDAQIDEEFGPEVLLSGFRMGKYEVTFEEYDRFCAATNRPQPSDYGKGRGQMPVIGVSWLDAISYCNWLSEEENLTPVYSVTVPNLRDLWKARRYNSTGLDIRASLISADWKANGYRLPTEAEWEFAASYQRSREGKAPYGNGQEDVDLSTATFAGTSSALETNLPPPTGPTLVNQKGYNKLKIYNLSGNVSEWCWDYYGAYRSGGKLAAPNPRGPNSGTDRVHRGGGWSSPKTDLRTTARGHSAPDTQSNSIGFRVVRNVY
ncbi:MAG: SUMF1/EgtB/PvdO family nonheme iron enzyme [Bacteroidota bacterium]